MTTPIAACLYASLVQRKPRSEPRNLKKMITTKIMTKITTKTMTLIIILITIMMTIMMTIVDNDHLEQIDGGKAEGCADTKRLETRHQLHTNHEDDDGDHNDDDDVMISFNYDDNNNANDIGHWSLVTGHQSHRNLVYCCPIYL